MSFRELKDKKGRVDSPVQENPKVTLLTSDYGIVCGVSLVAIITVTT